jgi:hypothetical protein
MLLASVAHKDTTGRQALAQQNHIAASALKDRCRLTLNIREILRS